MKKRNLLLMLLLAIGLPWVANAQSVTIGSGTNETEYAPIYGWYNYSLSEMIYTSDEIAATNPETNTILKVGFNYTGSGSKDCGVTVYMKNVSASDFATSSDVITLSASDAVYTGTWSLSSNAGWIEVDLDVPFTYNSSDNLLIAVDRNSGTWFSNNKWQCSTTTNSTMWYFGNDNTNPDPTSPSGGSVSTSRPNVKLTFGAPPTCFAPQNLTCTEYTATSATLTWQRHASGTENAGCCNTARTTPLLPVYNPLT